MNTNDYGSVTSADGTVVVITQSPYLDGQRGESCYRATGRDADGNDYTITWDNLGEGHVNDEGGDCVVCGGYCKYEDEANCADWDHPIMVERD